MQVLNVISITLLHAEEDHSKGTSGPVKVVKVKAGVRSEKSGTL